MTIDQENFYPCGPNYFGQILEGGARLVLSGQQYICQSPEFAVYWLKVEYNPKRTRCELDGHMWVVDLKNKEVSILRFVRIGLCTGISVWVDTSAMTPVMSRSPIGDIFSNRSYDIPEMARIYSLMVEKLLQIAPWVVPGGGRMR